MSQEQVMKVGLTLSVKRHDHREKVEGIHKEGIVGAI